MRGEACGALQKGATQEMSRRVHDTSGARAFASVKKRCAHALFPDVHACQDDGPLDAQELGEVRAQHRHALGAPGTRGAGIRGVISERQEILKASPHALETLRGR